MVFIDAFSSTYLNKDYAPFLYDLQQKGYIQSIKQLPAFMGIGTTLFSGTWPVTNGGWTNFIKKENGKSFSPLMANFFLISDLIPNDRLSWDFRYLIYKLLNKPVPIPNLIPAYLLKFFVSKMDSIFQDKALGNIPTLFDAIKGSGKTFTIINQFLDSDEKIAERTINYLERGSYSDLIYLKFSSLDSFGHKFGPNSKLNYDRVRIIDTLIKNIIETAKNCDDDFSFLIFSDHGMSPVSEYIDIFRILSNTSLKICKDYIIFLDSTMARFWFNNEKARQDITYLLPRIKNGYVLTDIDLYENNLPINKAEHGELIFALKEGTVMRPDFFHNHTIMKGMHGHFKSHYDNPILLLDTPHPYKKNSDSVEFINIMPTTLKLLDIAIPATCEGRSLI